MSGQHIHSTGGTVIVEIIIAVHAVLGHVVDVNRLEDVPFLFVRQVQHLLCHAAAIITILSAERFKRLNPHLIVGQAKVLFIFGKA